VTSTYEDPNKPPHKLAEDIGKDIPRFAHAIPSESNGDRGIDVSSGEGSSCGDPEEEVAADEEGPVGIGDHFGGG
jgi:hypothetical protein